MADAICRWRNGTPNTVVKLVNALPHKIMPNQEFRDYMSANWKDDFFHTAYQLACQLALYYESSTDGLYYPRFDHDISEEEAEKYLYFWFPKYYIPNPYMGKNGFQDLECPTYFVKSLYDYAKVHRNCSYKEAYNACFHEQALNNNDIIKNYINRYSKVLIIHGDDILDITDYDPNLIFNNMERNDKQSFFNHFNDYNSICNNNTYPQYNKFLTALKTKPFLLLTGISGTGKSRLVKELAFMTCPKGTGLDNDKNTPGNYCLIEVKPDWHDSTELLGYFSVIFGIYELTTFIRFVYKAIQNPNVPFFVCLDEMNLAPIEQYFAEYLSVLETRKFDADSHSIISAELLSEDKFNNCNTTVKDGSGKEKNLYSTKDTEIINYLKEKGLRLPQNLFVIGTVNMDDTTHQFSRKVIDRAFTIEMNGSDLKKMFDEEDTLNYTDNPLDFNYIKPEFVYASEVLDAYPQYAEIIKEKVPLFLESINDVLKNTPFKVSYRVQNELIIYIASLIRQTTEDVDIEKIINEASLCILMEKILPRVEGDSKLLDGVLNDLKKLITSNDTADTEGDEPTDEKSVYDVVANKLKEMNNRLTNTYFTSFFS